jgi:hypothetical protein
MPSRDQQVDDRKLYSAFIVLVCGFLSVVLLVFFSWCSS